MNAKQIWTLIGLAAAVLIIANWSKIKNYLMNYSRNGARGTNGNLRETGIPCCTKRDANCKCIEYVYKKSEDCETVPCPTAIDTSPKERPVDIFLPDTTWVVPNSVLNQLGIGPKVGGISTGPAIFK